MARRTPREPAPPPPSFATLDRAVLTLEAEEALKRLMSERVLQVRRELGLTQLQVGTAFGRSQPWAREVESARQWVPHWTLLALARATGRSVGWFYGEDTPTPAAKPRRARRQ